MNAATETTTREQIEALAASTGVDASTVEMLANMVAGRLESWTGSNAAAIEAADDLEIVRAAVEDSSRAVRKMAIKAHTRQRDFAETILQMVAA